MKRKCSTTTLEREPSPVDVPLEKTCPDLSEAIGAKGAAIVGWLVRAGLPIRDAPDVAQDVLLDAWCARERYDATRGGLTAWLRGIAKSHASHYRNRVRVRLERLIDATSRSWSEVLASASTPEEKAARAEQLCRAHSLLSHLAPERAVVLLRHDGLGESMKSIAASLGIPEPTGYTRLRLARADVAQAIRRDEARQRGPKPATERGSKRGGRPSR